VNGSRGRRALALHSVQEWEQLVRDEDANVERMADVYGAGSREHAEAMYSQRRAARWRDDAAEEHARQHRDDGRDDWEVAREVADRLTRRY